MITYELKKTNPPTIRTRVNGTTTSIVNIGFMTGVVGCPDSYGMLAGDTLEVTVLDATTKTQDAIDLEVINAVVAFIANKYPSTGE